MSGENEARKKTVGGKAGSIKPLIFLVVGLVMGAAVGMAVCSIILYPQLDETGEETVSTNTYLPNKLVVIEGYEFSLYNPKVKYEYGNGGMEITVVLSYDKEEIAMFSGWVSFRIVPLGAEPK